MICALPSGIRRRRTISATVPIEWICSGCTSSISASRCAARTMRCRSSLIAAVIAATLFSRPTPSGTTSFGKTTISRSGTSASSFGNSLGVVVFVVVSSVISCVSFPLCARDAMRMSSSLERGSPSAGPVVALVGRLPELLEQAGDVVELQEQLDSCQIHAAHLREVSDHLHAPEVLVGVKPDVRVGADRLEQALLLVDPERP